MMSALTAGQWSGLTSYYWSGGKTPQVWGKDSAIWRPHGLQKAKYASAPDVSRNVSAACHRASVESNRFIVSNILWAAFSDDVNRFYKQLFSLRLFSCVHLSLLGEFQTSPNGKQNLNVLQVRFKNNFFLLFLFFSFTELLFYLYLSRVVTLCCFFLMRRPMSVINIQTFIQI